MWFCFCKKSKLLDITFTNIYILRILGILFKPKQLESFISAQKPCLALVTNWKESLKNKHSAH